VRICPEIASFTRTAHDAEKDHRIYSILDGAIVSSKSKPFVDCIQDCIVLGYLPPRLGWASPIRTRVKTQVTVGPSW
jgi:hypothetical protein